MQDYKETEVWQRAKSLVLEAYRVTRSWPEAERGLADDLRSSARAIAKSVPRLVGRFGRAGLLTFKMSLSTVSDLEILCSVAVDLGIAEKGEFDRLTDLMQQLKAEFLVLGKAAREKAQEQRSKLMGLNWFDDDEE